LLCEIRVGKEKRERTTNDEVGGEQAALIGKTGRVTCAGVDLDERGHVRSRCGRGKYRGRERSRKSLMEGEKTYSVREKKKTFQKKETLKSRLSPA